MEARVCCCILMIPDFHEVAQLKQGTRSTVSLFINGKQFNINRRTASTINWLGKYHRKKCHVRALTKTINGQVMLLTSAILAARLWVICTIRHHLDAITSLLMCDFLYKKKNLPMSHKLSAKLNPNERVKVKEVSRKTSMCLIHKLELIRRVKIDSHCCILMIPDFSEIAQLNQKSSQSLCYAEMQGPCHQQKDSWPGHVECLESASCPSVHWKSSLHVSYYLQLSSSFCIQATPAISDLLLKTNFW